MGYDQYQNHNEPGGAFDFLTKPVDVDDLENIQFQNHAICQ